MDALVNPALACAVFVGSVALLSHGGVGTAITGSEPLDVLGVVLAALTAAPIIVWRRSPLGAFAVSSAVSVMLAGLGYPLVLMLGPAVALYLLVAHRTEGDPTLGRTVSAVAGLLAAYVGAYALARGGAISETVLLHNTLALAVAWFAGERTRLGREQIAELKARAIQAERAAERERRLAAAEERARIARDLHDSAGHAINVIVVRAGAARLRHDHDPERSLRALEVIEDVARQTADEIDHIVGTLREDDVGHEPVISPIGLVSLDALIARHTATGLAVTVDRRGTPHALSTAADQAAFRILQESLTNAARYGGGSAHVQLEFHDEAFVLCVTNPVPVRNEARAGGGHGLPGMRERTLLLGGAFEAEHGDRTFRVRACIPYRGTRR